MSNSSSSLRLIVPGLLGPMPGVQATSQPVAPWLETTLARASVSDSIGADLNSTLFHLFGLRVEEGHDLPTAPLCRLADGGEPDGGYWLHADPVFFKADRDRLLLFDAGMLSIRAEDAEALGELFNDHFKDEGWRLHTLIPERWYLRLPISPDLVTHPLASVIGRNIDSYLPEGEGAIKWHSLLNEVQMLFNNAEINVSREAEGLLPVNGLWFSGGGVLPKVSKSRYSRIVAELPLAGGLALQSGTDVVLLPNDTPAPDWFNGAELWIYHAIWRSVLDADPLAWVSGVEIFEAWVASLMQALGRKRFDLLELYPCNGRVYRLDRWALRRFWKARTSLYRYLS